MLLLLLLRLNHCARSVLQLPNCDADNVTFEQFAEAFAKPSQVSHPAGVTRHQAPSD
jgi:hypothetical protein